MADDLDMRIRFIRKEDLHWIHRILLKPEVMWGTLQIPSRQVQWLADMWRSSETRMTLVAELDGGPQKGQVIGQIGMSLDKGRRRHVASLGMAVDPDFHGRGVGTALMAAALEHADKWWKPIRYELDVYPDNHSAVSLYKKHGFCEEGLFRHFAIREGRFTDALAMAIIRQDGREEATWGPVASQVVSEPGPSYGGPAGLPAVDAFARAIQTSARGFATTGCLATGSNRGVTVRPVNSGDAAQLEALYQNPGVFRNSQFLPWDIPSADKIKEDIEQTPAFSVHRFVALIDGMLVGEIELQPGRHRMARTGRLKMHCVPPGFEDAWDYGDCGRAGWSSEPYSVEVAASLFDKVIDLADNWLMLERLETRTYSDQDWLFPILCGAGFQREAVFRMDSLRDGVYEDRYGWARVKGLRLP